MSHLTPRRHLRLAGSVLAAGAVLSLSTVALGTGAANAAATASSGDGHASAQGQALRHFQTAHGLAPTGRTDATTAKALQTASPSELRAIYPAATASYTLNASQRTNARTVIGVGKGHDIPRRGIEIALMTAMQESKFVNYTTPVDHDSLGIFQQRPSTGWGTPSQITNVVLSSQSFYGVAKFGDNPGLLQISGWQSLTRGQAAQRVQVSAYPDAYDQWQSFAIDFYDQQAGSVAPITGDSGSAGPGTGTDKYYVDTISDAPVYGSATSTTRTGTLNKGTNYVYCKVAGRVISNSSGSAHNKYWLRTDPDSGPATSTCRLTTSAAGATTRPRTTTAPSSPTADRRTSLRPTGG